MIKEILPAIIILQRWLKRWSYIGRKLINLQSRDFSPSRNSFRFKQQSGSLPSVYYRTYAIRKVSRLTKRDFSFITFPIRSYGLWVRNKSWTFLPGSSVREGLSAKYRFAALHFYFYPVEIRPTEKSPMKFPMWGRVISRWFSKSTRAREIKCLVVSQTLQDLSSRFFVTLMLHSFSLSLSRKINQQPRRVQNIRRLSSHDY